MSSGLRHDDLRRRNRAMVIAAVREAGRPSRTEIASRTGLSHSTISAIASDLISERVLLEVRGGEAAGGRRGRPQVALGLDPDAATVAAIVLSLNVLSFTLIGYAGEVILHRQRRLLTQSAGRAELLAAVTDGLRDLVSRSGRRIARVTMAVQGITDAAARRLLWSPITPHGDIPFAATLEREFGVPATVENDCNMIALALRARQAGSDDNLIAILLSDGIGMGMILSGNLFVGAHSSGGEFGHMTHVPGGALCRCGRQGCIEAYAGNYAILRNARGENQHQPPEADIDDETMRELAAAARRSEGAERRAFAKAGTALGYGLGSLFALIDPAPISIVGRGAAAFDLIEPALRAAYRLTAGGQHGPELSFRLETDEAPLIREGCARRALAHLDAEVFARGTSAMAEALTPA